MERITARTHASFFSKQPARSSRKRLLLSPASVRLTTGMDATGDVCVCKGMRSYAVLAFVCIRMCVCMCVAKVCVQHCGTGLRGPTLRAALGRLSVLQRPPSLCNIASDSLPSLKKYLRPHSEPVHTQSGRLFCSMATMSKPCVAQTVKGKNLPLCSTRRGSPHAGSSHGRWPLLSDRPCQRASSVDIRENPSVGHWPSTLQGCVAYSCIFSHSSSCFRLAPNWHSCIFSHLCASGWHSSIFSHSTCVPPNDSEGGPCRCAEFDIVLRGGDGSVQAVDHRFENSFGFAAAASFSELVQNLLLPMADRDVEVPSTSCSVAVHGEQLRCCG